ncbi:hypothetical protein JZ751_005013, partial [Albula glossodonta]
VTSVCKSPGSHRPCCTAVSDGLCGCPPDMLLSRVSSRGIRPARKEKGTQLAKENGVDLSPVQASPPAPCIRRECSASDANWIKRDLRGIFTLF